MNYETASNTIRTRITTLLTGFDADIVIQYDNVAVTPPDDEQWARLSVRWGDPVPGSFGSPGRRRMKVVGVASTHLYVPLDIGENLNHQLGKVLCDGLKFVTVNDVRFRSPAYRPLGAGNGWYTAVVDAPFFVEAQF